MNTARIHDAYVRATLHNVAETTRSAHPMLKMPPRLRRDRTLRKLCATAVFITSAVGLVLYLAARI